MTVNQGELEGNSENGCETGRIRGKQVEKGSRQKARETMIMRKKQANEKQKGRIIRKYEEKGRRTRKQPYGEIYRMNYRETGRIRWKHAELNGKS